MILLERLGQYRNAVGVSGLWMFIEEATSLAAGIHLQLPPINSEAVLESFCGQLFLPKVSFVFPPRW